MRVRHRGRKELLFQCLFVHEKSHWPGGNGQPLRHALHPGYKRPLPL